MYQPNTGPPISTSMRSSYKSCPRKTFHRYVAGIEVKRQDNPARAIGRAFHRGLELWREGEPAEQAINVAISGLRDSLVSQDMSEESDDCIDHSARLSPRYLLNACSPRHSLMNLLCSNSSRASPRSEGMDLI